MKLEPVPFKLVAGSDSETRLKRYLRDKVRSLREGLAKLHGLDGVVKWRKAYDAIPAEPIREFPWHGASNLVVPIIGIHTDTLLARIMAAIMKTSPFWSTQALGDYADKADEGLSLAVEEYLGYVAIEPTELDLYRVERDWFGDVVKLGTGTIKMPWVKNFIDTVVPAGDGTRGPSYSQKLLYEGPRPEKIRFEDFKYPVSAPTIEAMDFKYHVIHLQRDKLEERGIRGIYNNVVVQDVLKSPDRTSPDVVQQQKESDANVSTVSGYGFAEWDICECHFNYRVDAKHYCKLIVWYHEQSNNILRSFYYYYTEDIFITARMFYRDDMFPGMGFAEILAPFQEEISQIHNQRRDNMTVANMKMFRVDPDSVLNKGFETFPSAMLPAKKDELEPIEFGVPVVGEIDSERLTLELAERRSGVSPPMQGQGAGTNTKRGVYTAMGTMALIQEGNNRTDLNITDIRYAHTKLGRLVCQEYAMFGIGDRELMFGEKGKQVKEALDAMMDGRMALPVYASTASINREVEKQNDMMLMGVADRYHQTISAMLAAANNPMTPPAVKEYTEKAVQASHLLMQTVYHHFGFDQVEKLAPKPPLSGVQEAPVPQPGQPGQQPSGPMPGPQAPPLPMPSQSFGNPSGEPAGGPIM